MTALEKLHQCIGCECCLAKQERKMTKLANIILPPTNISEGEGGVCDLCLKNPKIKMRCHQCNKTLCKGCVIDGNHCANGCEVFYCGECHLFDCQGCKMEYCNKCFYDTKHKNMHCEIHCSRCSGINVYGACCLCFEIPESEDITSSKD